MKIKTESIEVIKKEYKHVYIAEDGTKFESRRDCLKYEYETQGFSLEKFFNAALLDISIGGFASPEYINDIIMIKNNKEFTYVTDYLTLQGYIVDYATPTIEFGMYGIQYMDGGDCRSTAYIYNIEEMMNNLDDQFRQLGYKIEKI